MSLSFSGLRLFPLAAMEVAASRQESTRALPGFQALLHARPELITDMSWRLAKSQAASAGIEPAGWFVPRLPAGTVYDIAGRSQPDGSQPRFTAEQIAALRAQAPHSWFLVQESIRWKGETLPYEALRQEYGSLADYHLAFAETLAGAALDKPEIYIQQMQRVCQMNGEGYRNLASYYADRGRDDDARLAYERWLEVGRDQVAISRSMEWLVRHYLDHRETAKADALAQRVAEVGSYTGLVTQADFYDWSGDLEDAEQLYRRAWKRYDNGPELLGFYLRHEVKGPKVDEVLRAVFPSGMARLGATPLTAPSDGVVVRYAGFTALHEGLWKGDIVTAIDGVRVRTIDQYRAAANAGVDDAMQMVVWRGTKYVSLAPRLRPRWIVISLADYHRPGA